MSTTLAVFGAGPGFGLSVARRFGREGFQVALVARRQESLDSLVADLASDGIEAAGFTADLTDPVQLTKAVSQITHQLGAIDVLEYSPGGMRAGAAAVPVLEVDADALEPALDLLLRVPITLIRQVLPSMIERGDGAVLVTQAVSAIRPLPFAGNFGLAMAGMRNYLHQLNVVLADKGVYAGTLTIGALVQRSEIQQYVDAAADLDVVSDADRVAPDFLADTYWDMYTKRDRFEEVIGNLGL